MAVDLAKYVVSLEAETARYTQQLQSANNKLEQFERRNTASLKRLDRGFSDMSNRFTMVAAKIRSAFGLFGVAFGVRAFSGWIRDAIEIEKLTQEQAKAIGQAKAAVDAFKESVGDLAREFATRLAPAIETAAKFWKEFFFPSGSQFGAGADRLREQVDAQIEEVSRLQRLLDNQKDWEVNSNAFSSLIFGSQVDNIRATAVQLAAARVELDRISQIWRDAQGVPSAFSDFFGGGAPDKSQLEFQKKVFDDQRRATAQGQDLSPEIRAFVENLERAEKLTKSMRTEVEEQVEEWREAKLLFDAGVLDAETLNRLDESQLQPIKVTAKRIKDTFKDVNEDAKKFAESMGQSFQNAFADWILGADRSFSDLLKRMAAKMATSALFKGLASLFPGGSFFSNFFGGARAEGGPVSAGRAYLVGERGPEMFIPGASGMIAANAGGGITIVNHIDARGADPSLAQRLPSILADNNQRLKAEIKHELGRGR